MQRSHTCSFRVIAHYLSKIFQDLIHFFFGWLLSPNLIQSLSKKEWFMKSDEKWSGSIWQVVEDKIVQLVYIDKKRDNPICFWFNVSTMAQCFKVLYTHKYISQAYIQSDKCKWDQTNTRRPSIYYPQRLPLNSRPISTLVEFSS